jgi:excisionase family DNA binding protein
MKEEETILMTLTRTGFKDCVKEALLEVIPDLELTLPVQKDKEDKLMTRDELKQYLGISYVSIYKKMKAGKLPYKKFGKRVYFSHAEIMKILDSKGGYDG